MNNTNSNIPLYRPPIRENARKALLDCFDSGWWGYGPACRLLESRFTDIHGGWALATSSCTSALYVAARLTYEQDRNEIIVPAITWVSSAITFIQAGFNVRPADVNPDTLLLTAELASKQITPKTRAILAVHLYGQKCAISELRKLCDEHDLLLIEDCAHHLSLQPSPISDFRCYSFNVLKEVPCGEGGLIWGKNMQFEVMANQLACLGMQGDTFERSAHPCHGDLSFGRVPGLKLKMNDLAASIAMAMLAHLGPHRAERKRIFSLYDESLRQMSQAIRLLTRPEDDSMLMYVIRVSDGKTRTTLRNHLSRSGISTSVHYPSLSRHPLIQLAKTPVADIQSECLVTLPCYPDLAREQQLLVISHIQQAVSGGA